MKKLVVDKEENRLSNYIVLELYLPIIKFCIVQSIPGLFQYNGFLNAVLGVVLAVLFIRNVLCILGRSPISLVSSACVLFVLFASSLFFGGDNLNNMLSAVPDILIISLTLFLTTMSIRNYNLLFEKLLKYAPVVISFVTFMVLSIAIIGVVGVTETDYNMSLSYYALVPTLVLYSAYKERHHIFHLVFFILGFVSILTIGSRGPLMCVILFVLLLSLKTTHLNWKTISVFIILLIGAIIVFVNFEEIVGFLYNWLKSHNIESRTLQKLVVGTFTDDSGRAMLMSDALALVADNLYGIGFMGDLRTHNILIENVLWFGFMPGIILDTAIVIITVKTLFVRVSFKDKQSLMLMIFFLYAIPDAMLNLTVWGKDMFWIYLAIFISLHLKKYKGVRREW